MGHLTASVPRHEIAVNIMEPWEMEMRVYTLTFKAWTIIDTHKLLWGYDNIMNENILILDLHGFPEIHNQCTALLDFRQQKEFKPWIPAGLRQRWYSSIPHNNKRFSSKMILYIEDVDSLYLPLPARSRVQGADHLIPLVLRKALLHCLHQFKCS